MQVTYKELQHIVAYCSVLQYWTEVQCVVLYYTALWCTVLHSDVLKCNVLNCSVRTSGSTSPSHMIQQEVSEGSLTTFLAASVSTPSVHSRVSMSICPRSLSLCILFGFITWVTTCFPHLWNEERERKGERKKLRKKESGRDIAKKQKIKKWRNK